MDKINNTPKDSATPRPLYLPWKSDGIEITCNAKLDLLRHVAIVSDAEYADCIVRAVNRDHLFEELVEAFNESSEMITSGHNSKALKVIQQALSKVDSLTEK